MDQRLRVLFVTSWYPSRSCPVQGVFVREHAKAVQLYDDVAVLHVAGHDLSVSGLMRAEEERDLALTERLPTYRSWHRKLPISGFSTLAYAAAAMATVGVIKRSGFQPNIVHAHVYSAGVPAAFIAAWQRIPMVLTEHNSAFPRRLLTSRQVRTARQVMARARVVMPVSQALQSGIEAYGIRASFQIVPNVVDTTIFHPTLKEETSVAAADMVHSDQLGPPARPSRLLFVGGLVPVKGIPTLLAALAMLSQTRHNWRLDVVGDGPCRAEYTAQAAQLSLEDQVTFHGYQPKAAVAAFMRQADALVLPSLWENSPSVIIEAMASGLPVVASRIGGIPELVTEQMGILAPPGDPDSLARSLASALDHPGQFNREMMVRAAEQYTPQVVGRTLDAIYRNALL